MISYALRILSHYLKPTAILLAVLAAFVCWRLCGRVEQKGKLRRSQRAAWAGLTFYLVLSFTILIFARIKKDGSHFSLQLFWSYRAIANGYTYLLYLDILNVLLFVPFGFLCPIAERKPGFWKTVGLGAAMSLLAELLQALSARGLFELDDLFHNIIGTALGAAIWLLIRRCRVKNAETGSSSPSASQIENQPDQDQAGVDKLKTLELSLFFVLLRAGILGEKPDLSAFAGQWSAIDPERLRTLALRHDVVLPVYSALDGTEEPVLRRLKKSLKSLYAPRFAKAVNQDAEGQELLRTFEQEGIDCIPLKGWRLRRFYADPLNRSMGDLDVLVRDYEHRRMLRIMRSLGFEGESLSAWKHENFKKAPYMNVELHRRLTDDSGAIRAWEKRMWSRSSLEPGCAHILRMADEDFYLHHLLHMYEDFRHGTLGFRRVADTWLLLRGCPGMDRKLLDAELEAVGILDFSRRMERLARACMDGETPDADTATLLRYAEENSVSGVEHSYQLARMASMSSGNLRSAKLTSLWNAVFLPYDRMKAQFPVVERHPVLLPLCWARRLLRMAKYRPNTLKKMKSGDISQQDLEEMRRVFRAGGLLPEEK